MIGGVLSVIAIYLLVNLALLAVLPIATLAGQAFAAGTVAGVIFGVWGDPVFRTITIVSMLSALNSNHLMASRVLFAMSRDGLVTRKAAIVNEGGTPTMALLASTVVAVVFVVVRTHVRACDHRARVLLCRELRAVVHLGVRVAETRAGEAAAVPRVGLSVDDSARPGGLDCVSDWCDRQRPGQQSDRAGRARRELSGVSGDEIRHVARTLERARTTFDGRLSFRLPPHGQRSA